MAQNLYCTMRVLILLARDVRMLVNFILYALLNSAIRAFTTSTNYYSMVYTL